MKKKSRLLWLIPTVSLLLLGLLAGTVLIISGGSQPFTGKIAEYCDALMEAGFPEDYAVALTKLHLLHPTWEFVPLSITDTNPDYVWDHVIDKETENPQTNLISSSDSYRDYHHAFNREVYDTGFYQPSRAAVEYFMDPRNFLTEADIFQFFDLSGPAVTEQETVEAVLAGTVWAELTLVNGSLCPEYLIQIGEEIGIDPVYLAVKLRQEQGVEGTSPIISGTCGDLLWSYYKDGVKESDSGTSVNAPTSGESQEALTALNGLYNPFNVNATGKGLFPIFKNAMLRAETGTPSQAEVWGGPQWNTLWKGLYGGALFIKEKYVDRYQSTIYLQKFNVDGRISENNFWSQYMQNLTGALTEGRIFFRSYAENDALDSACRFLIPVYKNMPSSPAKDPAKGSCTATATANLRYETTALLTSPQLLRASDDGIFSSVTVEKGSSLTAAGLFSHSYGIQGLQYSINGGPWIDCSQNGTLSLSLKENLPDVGEHILVIRAKADYDADQKDKKLSAFTLCAAFHFTVTPPPSVQVTIHADGDPVTSLHYAGDSLSLPVCENETFAGWLSSNGELYPSGHTLILSEDVSFCAAHLSLRMLDGAAVALNGSNTLRFYAALPMEEATALNELVRFGGTVNEHPISDATVRPLSTNGGESFLRIGVSSLPWNSPEQVLTAQLTATVTYADGTTKTMIASGNPTVRTPRQVVEAALSDPLGGYSPAELEHLRSLLT